MLEVATAASSRVQFALLTQVVSRDKEKMRARLHSRIAPWTETNFLSHIKAVVMASYISIAVGLFKMCVDKNDF